MEFYSIYTEVCMSIKCKRVLINRVLYQPFSSISTYQYNKKKSTHEKLVLEYQKMNYSCLP